MRKELKEEINILMLKDVNKLLIKEELKYLIIENGYKIEVKDVPLVFTNYLNILYDYLAYDYDELDSIDQEKYKLLYKKIKKIDEYTYQYETKQYIKKSNN